MILKSFLKLDDLDDLEIRSFQFEGITPGSMKPANLLGGKQKEGDITVTFRGTAGHYAQLFRAYLKGLKNTEAIITTKEILEGQGWWRQKNKFVFSDCVITALSLIPNVDGSWYLVTLNFKALEVF